MNRALSILLTLLILLVSACGFGSQDTDIELPTSNDNGGIVIPTSVNQEPTLTTEPGDPRPEVTETPTVAATATTQPVATTAVQPTTAPQPTATTVAAACQPRTDWPIYTVVSGDTLFRIGQRVGSTVADLAQANCLTNVDNLIVGTKLYVPKLPSNTNPTSGVVRIQFPAGEYNTTLTGSLGANGVHNYVFTANAGQLLGVSFRELNGARVTVTSANGEKVVQGIGNFGSYLLPQTGDYSLTVSSATAANYTLDIAILPTPTAGNPERVQFAAGAVSARLTGNTGNQIKQFVVAAAQDQRLAVEFASGSFKVAVRGVDGQRLFEFDSAQPSNAYGPMYLPKTQDYVISILPFGAHAAEINIPYDLTLTIVNAGGGAETPAERITFFPGTISTIVTGTGSNTADRYVLRASAGQRLMLAFTPIPDQNGQRAFYVTGADGQLLVDGGYNVAVILPETQDYFITVNDVVGHEYNLIVLVDPNEVVGDTERIEFAPGATSARLTGQLNIGDTKRFVVRALAGQSFSLTPHPYAGSTFIPAIVDPNGQLLQPYSLNSIFVTQLYTLPATGDYTIFLLAVDNDAGTAASTYDYDLTIVTP